MPWSILIQYSIHNVHINWWAKFYWNRCRQSPSERQLMWLCVGVEVLFLVWMYYIVACRTGYFEHIFLFVFEIAAITITVRYFLACKHSHRSTRGDPMWMMDFIVDVDMILYVFIHYPEIFHRISCDVLCWYRLGVSCIFVLYDRYLSWAAVCTYQQGQYFPTLHSLYCFSFIQIIFNIHVWKVDYWEQ